MPRRTTLTQQTQLGVETTPGTSVAANRRLRSVSIDLAPEGNIRAFRATGSKFPSVAAPGKEWSSGDMEGAGTFTELLYVISGILGSPATTTPTGGTTTRQHDWTIAPSALQDPKTFTVEKGSSVRAHKASYVFINELGLEFNREEINVEGGVVGQAITDGVTLTGSPTDIALIPILPSQVSVYLDTTFAGLGTTKLLSVMSANWSLGDRFETFWPLDAAVPSFKDAFEVEPSSEITLTMEADATGMALLTPLRAGDIRYVRIEAVGATIEGALPYRLRLDCPLRFTEMPGLDDEDGIYGVSYTASLFDDGVNGAGSIRLVNTIAAM